MSIFNQFPWTNFREYNLDWVIRTVQDCKDTVDAALADVSNAVATYFAQHIDTTLTQAGDAADAAAVGSRLTTLGNRVTTLENNAVHYYNFKKQGADVNIIPNPLMTARTTTDALLADISNNYQYVILFEGFPAENVCVDPNDSDNLLFNSTLYNVVFDTTLPKGSYTARIDVAAAPVVIDDTVSPAVYAVGDFATLKAKALAYNMSAVMIQGSGQLYTVEFWHYDSGEDKVVLFGDNAPHLQYQCKADGTISAL